MSRDLREEEEPRTGSRKEAGMRRRGDAALWEQGQPQERRVASGGCPPAGL